MIEDLIELPEVGEIKEMLAQAKQDIQSEIKNDPELRDAGNLLTQVMEIVEGKLAKSKNLNKLSLPERIDIAAHLNFLQSLLENFFFIDGDFEDFDDEEDEDFDEDYEEEEEE